MLSIEQHVDSVPLDRRLPRVHGGRSGRRWRAGGGTGAEAGGKASTASTPTLLRRVGENRPTLCRRRRPGGPGRSRRWPPGASSARRTRGHHRGRQRPLSGGEHRAAQMIRRGRRVRRKIVGRRWTARTAVAGRTSRASPAASPCTWGEPTTTGPRATRSPPTAHRVEDRAQGRRCDSDLLAADSSSPGRLICPRRLLSNGHFADLVSP